MKKNIKKKEKEINNYFSIGPVLQSQTKYLEQNGVIQ